MSNHMPEVAKMLGYKDGEFFQVEYDMKWYTVCIRTTGIIWDSYPAGLSLDSLAKDALVGIIRGTWNHRPLPRYTIPSDLPVDAKVWVGIDGIKWKPRHFATLCPNNTDIIGKIKCVYGAWVKGRTKHSNQEERAEYDCWPFCITDEEYRKRKEGE